jgi:hypothetical protein
LSGVIERLMRAENNQQIIRLENEFGTDLVNRFTVTHRGDDRRSGALAQVDLPQALTDDRRR